jgi:hypothetical protein
MPTFSFPMAPNMVAAGAAVHTTTSEKEKTEQKKSRNMKKTGKHVVSTKVEEPSVTLDANHSHIDVPVEETTTTTTTTPVDNTEEEITHEPTFPDVVILKQTDKNYIVKHNHYPQTVHEKKGCDEASITIRNKTNIVHSSTENVLEASDLVSPNQIYKGQINKKRGRKPKAGFILNSNSSIYDTSEVPNIILHLKCHLSDLKANDSISNYDYIPSISEVESYNLSSNNLQSSDICQTYSPERDDDEDDSKKTIQQIYQPDPSQMLRANYKTLGVQQALSSTVNGGDVTVEVGIGGVSDRALLDTGSMAGSVGGATASIANGPVKKAATDSAIHVLNERHQKEIMKKINRLKYSFHNGETIQMKLNHKCACFWDTCEFDGPIYYMPIMIVNGVFHVSGCFCSPECALAAILKEQLDTSTKFERIHLLHLLYGSSNNKGFKPAPNPNYLLDRYYGNLTIDEYRSLLKGPQMIHIVNKPLTHILPELYEDNNDFLVNSKVIPTNNLKLKKRYKTMVVQGSGVD